jgi:hypothetical protein
VKVFLLILGVVALLLVLGGAVNHGTEVSLDYVAGSTAAVSLFWVAIVVAAALVLAGAAGWVIGRGGDAGARGKLEHELERTYRRLRECEAKLPQAPRQVAETVTLVAPAAESATLVVPPADEPATVVTAAPSEAATVVEAGPPPAPPAGDEPAAGDSSPS